MTIIQAFKKNKPIRLKGRSFSTKNNNDMWYTQSMQINPITFIDPEYLLSCVYLTKEDILSKEWEVQDGRKVLR
jgi:hypothetical protein